MSSFIPIISKVKVNSKKLIQVAYQPANNYSTKIQRFTNQQTRIGIVGAPLDRGQPKPGVEEGPKTCRESGFMTVLTKALGLDVKDYGDIDFGFAKRSLSDCITADSTDTNCDRKPSNLKNLKEVSLANKMISEAVSQILRDDRISLTLGGDHSIAIGSIHGASEVHNDLAVLWVDAHADINTSPTTLTGNMHGMPASFIIKELEPYMHKFSELDWLKPRISAKNIAYIGLRDVDFSERLLGQYNRSAIEMLDITAYSMREVDLLGIRNVTKMALQKISPGGIRPLHLSFDIDSLDDTEVLSTGTAVPGGLTLREANTLLEEIHQTGLMVSMDFVEVNPTLGTEVNVQRTISVIRQLLSNAFGYNRGGVSGGRIPPRAPREI